MRSRAILLTETARTVKSCTPFLAQPRRAHMVGALGSGMRSLARVLGAAGWELTSSDAAVASSSCVPGGAELVIASLAIPDDDADLVCANLLGIPVLRY